MKPSLIFACATAALAVTACNKSNDQSGRRRHQR